MRKPKWWLAAALPAVLVLGVAAVVFSIFIRAQHSLDRASVAVGREGRIPCEMRVLGRMENPGFEAIASPATYTSGAFYQGKLFVSGPSGLFVYGAGDQARGGSTTLLKIYRVGLDLPAAPLGRMAVGRLRGASQPELLIATSGAGILVFSGNKGSGNNEPGNGGNQTGGPKKADSLGSFRQLLPEDADARDVTALLPLPDGELLLGTRRHGLLVYRGGNTLESFHPRLANVAVTALAADATGFWVGTQAHGVLHWHGGQIDASEAASMAYGLPVGGVSDTLPDEHVEAIAVHGQHVFVGTPMGVEEFDDGRPVRTLAANLFVHALYADGKGVTIGSMEDGIRRVSLEAGRRPGLALPQSTLSEEIGGPAEQFLSTGADDGSGEMYAILRDGLRQQHAGGQWASLGTPLALDATEAAQDSLTDGNISALAFGPDGRLWVGYFDRGLDILSNDGRRAAHFEDDHLFCVNRIALDPQRRTMAVATANGAVLFDAQSKPRQTMTRRDGLISDHVTDIAFSGESMVLATPAGLTFVDAGGARSLYAFQGLVNNHVYALAVREAAGPGEGGHGQGGEVLAGTLGGISDLVHESVRRNFTVSNSGLKHNWVTAIVSEGDSNAGGAWMVGTYGAGVMLLEKDGRFTAMEGATRQMIVNPNAMLATGAHIFAGTLGQGLWVWSRAGGRWRQITAGLPSENVTAVAEQAGEVYVGTENGLVRIAERLLD